MAIPVWPSSLPQNPGRAGFVEKPSSNLLRTKSQAGIAKVRPKGGLIATPVSISYRMKESQVETFEDFVINTLSQGALRYSMTHPRSGKSIEVRILPTNSLYKITPYSSMEYTVSFDLEILP